MRHFDIFYFIFFKLWIKIHLNWINVVYSFYDQLKKTLYNFQETESKGEKKKVCP